GLTISYLTTLVFDATDPEILYVSTETGIFKSTDQGTSWHPLRGPPNAYRLAIDPAATILYAMSFDGTLFKSVDGGENWIIVSNAFANNSVSVLAIDPETPSNLYVGTFGSGLWKSSDGGRSWLSINSGLINPFIRSLAIDESDPEILYAGTYSFAGVNGGVFKSTDGGRAWVSASRHLTNTAITAFAVDLVNPTTLYGGSWGLGIFKSTDGGSSWIASNIGLTNFFVLSLAIDPLTPTTIYAGALENPGYNWTGAVFKSIDGGGTWTKLGLRDYISELLIDPQNSNIIYAANSGRVLKSTDAGDSC